MFDVLYQYVKNLTALPLPANIIAGALGWEHGKNGGGKLKPDHDKHRFEEHGVPFNESTEGAFNAGAIVGRFHRFASENFPGDGGGGYGPGGGRGGEGGYGFGTPYGEEYDDRGPEDYEGPGPFGTGPFRGSGGPFKR